MDNVVARHHRLAEGTRKAVEGWGLELLCANPRWVKGLVMVQVNSAVVLQQGHSCQGATVCWCSVKGTALLHCTPCS
jgi:alanine-glyoxylate transaminase/serine-glyoxylate transaminase/serine-pyruvate transaminase